MKPGGQTSAMTEMLTLAEQEFRLAGGTKIVRKKGGALFKYGDLIGVADVIFGEE